MFSETLVFITPIKEVALPKGYVDYFNLWRKSVYNAEFQGIMWLLTVYNLTTLGKVFSGIELKESINSR